MGRDENEVVKNVKNEVMEFFFGENYTIIKYLTIGVRGLRPSREMGMGKTYIKKRPSSNKFLGK